MLTLRHRSASGRLDQCWELDPGRGLVLAVLRLGSADPLSLEIKVCHPDRPRLLAHPIMRLDGESWRILPAIFVPCVSISRDRDRSRFVPRDCTARGNSMSGEIPCDVHAAVGVVAIALTHAPADRDAELEELTS